MVWDGDAGGTLDGLGLRGGMRLETSRHVWCDGGLVHLLVGVPRCRHPRIREVRLWVTQRVVAHPVELGLLAIVDSHCHIERDGGVAGGTAFLNVGTIRAVQTNKGGEVVVSARSRRVQS